MNKRRNDQQYGYEKNERFKEKKRKKTESRNKLLTQHTQFNKYDVNQSE